MGVYVQVTECASVAASDRPVTPVHAGVHAAEVSLIYFEIQMIKRS